MIIRSAGERTRFACRALILGQGVPEDQVFMTEEVPFSEAMRKSFKLGIREGRKWTFCIDADVLLRPGSILSMLEEAEKQPEAVCEIQGLVMDKFFGGPRPAGNHLYRTSMLPLVIEKIPREGVDIRPEHHALKAMAGVGYPWVKVPFVLGTHDDEQYFRDIYRKCFVQGVKHLYLADLLVNMWKRLREKDMDYSVALQAFSDSIGHSGKLYIDSRQSVYLDGFRQTGINEKEELDMELISLQEIERTITEWEESPEYRKHFPHSFNSKIRENHKEDGVRHGQRPILKGDMGIARRFLSYASRIMISTGQMLENIIN